MGYRFVKTDDGSAGLFDDSVNDIYHSSSGAYKEAIEKFVIPAQVERFKNSECNVLDICYGIGYNTKALLNYSEENDFNINFKIDALELNKDLINISPFIKFNNISYINELTDEFLLTEIIDNKLFDLDIIKRIINQNKKFLTLYKPNFAKILKNHRYNYGVLYKINSILHNIYYHYRSLRYIKRQKSYNYNKNSIKWHTGDARKSILTLNKKYDIIFLDAFTCSKQPILWTKEFLSILSGLLNKDTGVIVSYSIDSPFRKVLFDNNLTVGKYYLKNINSTLASYNENLVKYKLDDFELNLLNTKAGIPYEDNSLSHTSEQILEKRKVVLEKSSLESTSKFYKKYGKKHGSR